MKTADKLKKLNEYMGKDVIGPDATNTRWIDYQIDGLNVNINTSADPYFTPIVNLLEFLSGCMIIHEAQLPVKAEKNSLAISEVLPKDTVKNLAAVLIDNINKVKENPAYIKQATSITQSVNSIINLAKIELMINKQNKNK